MTRMELTNNDAAVRTDSRNAQAGTGSGSEIDLYAELNAFAELSPEEQLHLLDRPETVSAETEIASAHRAQENAFAEPVLTDATIEPVGAAMAAAEIDTPSTEEAEEHTSSEQVLTNLPIAPVESETTAAEVETDSTEEGDSHTSAGSAGASEISKAPPEPIKARPEPFETRPSGPLSGFSLTPDFVFTGALSRGVCLACGAESGADDLFCVSCGIFVDEIASTLPVKAACAECQQGIEVDEIFCPWCGSSVPEER